MSVTSKPRPNRPNLSASGIDLASLLRTFGQSAPSTPFDPYQPTQQPNPEYNPYPNSEINPFAVSGLPQFPAPVGPLRTAQDSRATVPGPSLADQRNTAERAAVGGGVTESDREIARLKAHSNLLKAQAEVLKHNPVPMEETPLDLPVPNRQTLPVPTRQTGNIDPFSTVIAGLAGLIDPSSAGGYGAVPFASAIQAADQQYADRQRQYAQATQELSQQYEDELFRRNEALKADKTRKDVNFGNALRLHDQALKQGELDAQVSNIPDAISAFQGLSDKERAGNLLSLEANQKGREIGEKERLSAQSAKSEVEAAKNETNLLRNILTYGARTETNQTRENIATQNNLTKENIARERNSLMKEVAAIRKQSSGGRSGGKEVPITTRLNTLMRGAQLGIDLSKELFPQGGAPDTSQAQQNTAQNQAIKVEKAAQSDPRIKAAQTALNQATAQRNRMSASYKSALNTGKIGTDKNQIQNYRQAVEQADKDVATRQTELNALLSKIPQKGNKAGASTAPIKTGATQTLNYKGRQITVTREK